jgi:hypothetical protein
MCHLCGFMAVDASKFGFCSSSTFNRNKQSKCEEVRFSERCTICNSAWDSCKQKVAHRNNHTFLLYKEAKVANLAGYTVADKNSTMRKNAYPACSAVTGPPQQVQNSHNKEAREVSGNGFSAIYCNFSENDRENLNALFKKFSNNKEKKTVTVGYIGKRRYVRLTREGLEELPRSLLKKLLVPIINFSKNYFLEGALADSGFHVTPIGGLQQEEHSDVDASLRGKVVVCFISFQRHNSYASTMFLAKSMFYASHIKFVDGKDKRRKCEPRNEFQPASTLDKKENIVLFDSAVLHYGAANTTGSDVVKLEINLYDNNVIKRPEDYKKLKEAFNYDIKKNLFKLEDLLLE